MVEQQGVGAAQLQMFAGVLPRLVEQKQLVDLADVGIGGESLLVQTNAAGVFVPHLHRDVMQMLIGEIQVHKAKIAAYVPLRCLRLGHQTKFTRCAAIFPALGGVLVAFVAIVGVEAKGVVVTQHTDAIVLVGPLGQLHA